MATKTPSPSDLSREVRWYLRQRGYRLPAWCRPAVRTPEPGDLVTDAVFDPARVDRVIAALRCMQHTQGRWAGRSLEPSAWQVAYILAPVFGWVRPDPDGEDGYVRIIRCAYVDVPRKNGKTTLSAGLSLYLAFADHEPGAQVLAVAAGKDQARRCFDPARAISARSPQLRAGGIRPLRGRIIRDLDQSYFEVVSSVGDLIHGTNVHAATIDELHLHRSPDVLDAVESGTGARTQPLVIIITTADEGRTDTVYAHRREYVEKLARRAIKDPTQYGVVFAAPAGANPFRESTWRAANPGYGVSPTVAFLRSEAAKARNSPATRARFERLHLGWRAKRARKYLDLGAWDRNASIVDPDKLVGRECYGGLDLAATSDLCAVAWDFPDGQGGHDVIWRLWAPEAKLRDLDDRTAGAATEWVRAGRLTLTPGEVTDYEYIRTVINADRERYDVREIAYDPWNSTQLVSNLLDDEAPMITMRQGFGSMSGPTKEFARLLLAGTAKKPLYRHGGNPAIRWQIDNFAVAMDAAGNVKPDKAHSDDKIDGPVAGIMALARAIAHAESDESVYNDNDLLVL